MTRKEFLALLIVTPLLRPEVPEAVVTDTRIIRTYHKCKCGLSGVQTCVMTNCENTREVYVDGLCPHRGEEWQRVWDIPHGHMHMIDVDYHALEIRYVASHMRSI